MATPTYAFWGALLGWLLMPRIRKSRGLRAFRPVISYVSAIVIALGVMYYFEYHHQAWIFILGMVAQLAVFMAASWLRKFIAKADRR